MRRRGRRLRACYRACTRSRACARLSLIHISARKRAYRRRNGHHDFQPAVQHPAGPVSYTHLDVYKRQRHAHAQLCGQLPVAQALCLLFQFPRRRRSDVCGRKPAQRQQLFRRAIACLLYTSSGRVPFAERHHHRGRHSGVYPVCAQLHAAHPANRQHLQCAAADSRGRRARV